MTRRTETGGRRAGRDRGVASLEFLGMLPLLLLIALAGIQLGLVAYCGQQAGTAARTAARTASEHEPHPDPRQAGLDAVSGWLRDGTHPALVGETNDKVTWEAVVDVPSVIPGVNLFGPVRRSATMPKEDDTP
jgi:Flp pilus assembly protein TadG